MIHLPTTETPGRRRRHIHKQARLVLPQTVLLRIVSLRFFVLTTPLLQITETGSSCLPPIFSDHFPETRLLQPVSVVGLSLMRLSIYKINHLKPM
jgi:hypothetical protein